jgi:hypothetical protein
VNEVGLELLRHWFLPHRSVPLAITGGEVLGGVPLEITDALLAVFRYLADRHDRGYMVEHIMELLATSWTARTWAPLRCLRSDGQEELPWQRPTDPAARRPGGRWRRSSSTWTGS